MEHAVPDRVSFLTADESVFEVHSVPLGSDANYYARHMFSRLQSIGRPIKSFSIAREEVVSKSSDTPQPALAVSRQLQHSTVRLECTKADGNLSSAPVFTCGFSLTRKPWYQRSLPISTS